MLIDISMPLKDGDIFRPGAEPIKISVKDFYHQSSGQFRSRTLCMSLHSATHIDLVFTDKQIDPERMMGQAKLIDLSKFSGKRILPSEIQNQVGVERGDFVIFRTDWDKYFGAKKYFRHPELPPEIIEWLIATEVNAVGIDASGLGRGKKHAEYDRKLAENNVLVIENLANLASIPQKVFKIYCFPLRIEDVDALPARVLAEIRT